jgi:eukaryotic-like serine/threonine-protein kinase
LAQESKLVGTVVAGRYRVLRLLGQGGMGAVYEVEHTLIGRRFALKTLHPEFVRNDEAVERFHREARAAAAIGDAHIVEVSDMGHLDDGSPFIVLELLQGQDLAHLLKQTGALTIKRAIDIACQACGALGRAHDKGIVHRDIKPDNLFIEQRDGEDFVKLLDFGISKVQAAAIGMASGALTRTGMALGTPYYMAPEQISGERSVDARADIYAMGAVVFEMLTGRVPFDATTFPMLVIKVMQEAPPTIATFRSGIPSELEAVVHKALAKNPDDRFATIREMADALVRFESVQSAPPAPMPRASLADTSTPRTWEVATTPSLRPESIRVPKRGGLGIAVGAVVLLGGAGAMFALRSPSITPQPDAGVTSSVTETTVEPPTPGQQPASPTQPPSPQATAQATALPAAPSDLPAPCNLARDKAHGEPLARALQLVDKKPSKPTDTAYVTSATALAEQAVAVDPDCAQAWSILALARYRVAYDACGRGDYEQAAAAADKALELADDDRVKASTLRTLGRIASAQLNWADADRFFAEAQQLAPTNFDAKSWRGAISVVKNVRPELLQTLATSLAGEPLTEGDLSHLTSEETAYVGDSVLARHGRRLNMAPRDWLFFCDASPLTPHPFIDATATRRPIERGSVDEANLKVVESIQRAKKQEASAAESSEGG